MTMNYRNMKNNLLFSLFLLMVTSAYCQKSSITLANKYFSERKFDKAEITLEAILSNEKLKLTKLEYISIYTDLGKINTTKGNYPKSLQYLILAKSKNKGDSTQFSYYNVAFGTLFDNIGATSLAINYYKKAYTFNTQDLSRYYLANTIGCMFLNLNELDSAIYYFDSQLKTSLLISDYIAKASSLNNLGIAQQKKKKYNKALELFFKARKVLEENNSKISPNFPGEQVSFLNEVISNIGQCYFSMKHYSEAIPYLEKSYIKDKKIYDVNGQIKLATQLVSSYLKTKTDEKAKAIEHFFESQTNKMTLPSKLLLLTMEEEIAIFDKDFIRTEKINEKLKEIRNQREHERTISIDNMNEILTQFMISEAKIKINIEKEQKWQLKKTVELKKHENQFLLIVSFSAFILLMIIGFLYFQYTRNKSKKIQLEIEFLELEDERQKLQIKSQENYLTEFAIENTLKKEYAKELLKNLNHLISVNETDVKMEIKNLIFELKTKELFSENREELNNQSGLLLIHFKTKLDRLHPNLSKSDIELCCLIKLNLSNKEIALHKNVTDESVKIFKNRLKKKMELTPSTILNSYISEI